MQRKHNPITLVRGFITLLLIPLLIGLVSIAALLLHYFRAYSGRRLQWLPRWSGRMLCRAGGLAVTVRGGEQLDPAKSYIFAVNHQSQFDIFVLQAHLDFDFRWLAKKELFAIPIFGPAMRVAGYIPVDRSHGRRAVQSLDEAAKRIAGGTSVVIFPEGTRSPDGKAKMCHTPSAVLGVRNTNRLFTPGTFRFNTCRDNIITLDLLARLTPEDETASFTVKGLMEQVRSTWEGRDHQ